MALICLRCRHHPPTAAGPHQRTTELLPSRRSRTRCDTAAAGAGSRRWISSTWRRPASRRPRRQGRPAPTATPASRWPGLSSRRSPAGCCRRRTASWCWTRPACSTRGWRAAEAPRRRDIASHDFDGRDIFWSPGTGRRHHRYGEHREGGPLPIARRSCAHSSAEDPRSGRPGIKVRGQQSAPLAFLASPQARWQGPLVRVNVSRGDFLSGDRVLVRPRHITVPRT